MPPLSSWSYPNSDKENRQKRRFSSGTVISSIIGLAILALCGFSCYRFVAFNAIKSDLEKGVDIQVDSLKPERSLQDEIDYSITIRNNSQINIEQLAIVIADSPFQNFVLRGSEPQWIGDERPAFSSTRRLIYSGLAPNQKETYAIKLRPKTAGDYYFQAEIDFKTTEYGWLSFNKYTDRQRIVILP